MICSFVNISKIGVPLTVVLQAVSQASSKHAIMSGCAGLFIALQASTKRDLEFISKIFKQR